MGRLYRRRASHWYARPSRTPGSPLFTISQVLIKHRAPDDALTLVENILRPLQCRYVYMSYKEHDEVTANTQAVTHAAFLTCVHSL